MENNRIKRSDSQRTKLKFTALITISAVALIFISLGIFLDGEVLPEGSDSEKLIKQTEQQVNDTSDQNISKTNQSDSSEYMEKFSLAIESATEAEKINVSELERRTSMSKTSIDEINQLVNLDSDIDKNGLENTRLDEFNRSLDKLQNQLSELEESN